MQCPSFPPVASTHAWRALPEHVPSESPAPSRLPTAASTNGCVMSSSLCFSSSANVARTAMTPHLSRTPRGRRDVLLLGGRRGLCLRFGRTLHDRRWRWRWCWCRWCRCGCGWRCNFQRWRCDLRNRARHSRRLRRLSTQHSKRSKYDSAAEQQRARVESRRDTCVA